jgi:hypothetical protein
MIKTKRSELCSWAVDQRQKIAKATSGRVHPNRIRCRNPRLQPRCRTRAIKLGEGEHLLRSGGTAGDSFVGFDGIFERYRVYSRQL